MFKHKAQSGFTFIDLMTSISVVFILLTFAMPTFANIRDTVALQNQAQQIISTLRTAQANSIMSLNGHAHGVSFATSEYTPFEQLGGAGEEQNLIAGLLITEITEGVAQEVLFERLTGRTVAQEIEISSPKGVTKTIHISETGSIAIE